MLRLYRISDIKPANDLSYISISVSYYSEKKISDFFQTAMNMIVVRILLLIEDRTDLLLFHNKKENSHRDHILLNLKRIRNQIPKNLSISLTLPPFKFSASSGD